MTDWVEFTAKTVDEALTEALIHFETTSEKIEYEVLERESSGFIGLFSKPARIRIRKKESLAETAKSFLEKVFSAMGIIVRIEVDYSEEERILSIELKGEEMGMLIGKRGQTLDSLQYLTSLAINKYTDEYIKVKLDTEDYRSRRKETIENLARNVASKVKKTRRPSYLEPMNPYERRLIHSTLQEDKMVDTYSEGDEPFRKVVVVPSKELNSMPRRNNYRNNNYRGKNNYSKR
ncbi:MAG: protein jag [Lachnoclostridium sp.]|jgi:spoIIIJ-associated protein|nr:protein jag [Lachnoclostridium sp.]